MDGNQCLRAALAALALSSGGCKGPEASALPTASTPTVAVAPSASAAPAASNSSPPGERAPLPGESLVASMDHPERAAVGAAVQLNCTYNWRGNPPSYLPQEDSLRWFSDPPDAIGFANRYYAVLLRPGPVRIWATYPGDASLDAGASSIRSNAFELPIGPGSNATPIAVWLENDGYTLAIHEDGAVYYVGSYRVKIKGRQSDRISPEALRKILDESDAAGFATVRGEGPQLDLPMTVLAIRKGGTAHAAMFLGGSEPIKHLIGDIEQAVNVERWAGKPGEVVDDSPVQGALRLVDLNTAQTMDLVVLAGLSEADATKVIAHRPYTSKEQLVSRKILSRATYAQIQDRVTVEKK